MRCDARGLHQLMTVSRPVVLANDTACAPPRAVVRRTTPQPLAPSSSAARPSHRLSAATRERRCNPVPDLSSPSPPRTREWCSSRVLVASRPLRHPQRRRTRAATPTRASASAAERGQTALPPPRLAQRGAARSRRSRVRSSSSRRRLRRPSACARAERAAAAQRSASAVSATLLALHSVLTALAPGGRRDAAQAQHFSVVKVRGDGRCMFRALVRCPSPRASVLLPLA